MTLLKTIFYIDQKRIEWVDIAKGVAIILVIIGHTVPMDSTPFKIIFSFHVPLFFLLSGYTFKIARTKEDLSMHIIKNLKHLIIPSLFFLVITSVIGQMHNMHTIQNDLLSEVAFQAERFLWGSGIAVNGHPGIGAVWFLISLFWAKTIIDILHLLFSYRTSGCFCLSLGFVGIMLGSKRIYLPQNMDVTFVAALFIYLGILWRKNVIFFERWRLTLLLISTIIWITCVHFQFYTNMAWRHYPAASLMITESVCGSFVFCHICKIIRYIRFIRIPMQILGIHSLLILFFHSWDEFIYPIWTYEAIGKTIISRLEYILFASFIFLLTKSLVEKIRKHPYRNVHS